MNEMTLNGSRRRAIALMMILSHLSMIGCATRPERIAPAFVSEQSYEGKSCETLGEELRQVSDELAVLSLEQDSTATVDTTAFWVGMLLLWPVTFVPLFTNDEEVRISELKGQQRALDSSIAGNCRGAALPPEAAPSVTPAL